MPKKPESSKKSKPRPVARVNKVAAKGSKSGLTKAAQKAGSVPVIATIKNVDALNELPQLAEKLASEGMTVNQVLPLSGAISGSAPPDQIAALNRKVPGVVVERELTAETS